MMLNTNRYTFSLWISIFLFPASIFSQIDFTSSNIPLIIIKTNGQYILDDPRIVADMKIIDNGENRNHISDLIYNYNGKISIEIRGSSSQLYPKKQFGFETINNDGSNNNVSLLGLPTENDWILSAPYSDKSLIRNVLAYKLSETLGNYAPRTKLCELLLNGEYAGVYVLTEKIKRDDNRVNISKMTPDDITGNDLTGGYIIKIDKLTGNSGPVWHSEAGGIAFQHEYPKHDKIAHEQKDYIKNYIDNFERALMSENFMDPEAGYRKYINENSFVDYFIANEISKNVDGYFLSTFFFKDDDRKGGKLTMGPIWDFNLAFGNADYREGFLTDGFQVELNASSWWWKRLLQDSIFATKIQNRWCSIRDDLFSDNTINSTIDSLSSLLDEAQQRNFEKWDIIGSRIIPNYYVGESYEDEIIFLKTWTLGRLYWLDERFSCIENTIPVNNEVYAYPNPFSDFLVYDFSLNKSGIISVILYDISGTQVAQIVDNIFYSQGAYSINWNSSETPGSIYFIVLKIDGEIISGKKIIKF